MLGLTLLLLLGFFHSHFCVPCVDKFAFSNIDAKVRRSPNDVAVLIQGRSLSELDYFSTVDVSKGNVTQLCEGMVKGLPKLQSLTLINVNMSDVHAGAFKNVPVLSHLSLAVNHLEKICKGAFSDIPKLQVLYLSHNKIHFIEEGALSNMPFLQSVYLDKNKISTLEGNIFFDSPNMRTVDFSHNLIQTISLQSFKDLKTINRGLQKIILKKNSIRTINSEAFKNLGPVYVQLQGNKIYDISYALFDNIQENSALILDKNEIACVPDEIVDRMRNTTKNLSLLDNPIICKCLDRMRYLLRTEIYGKGRLYYSTTFPCDD